MALQFGQPWILALLVLGLVPWLRPAVAPRGYSHLPLLPDDLPSSLLHQGLKLVTACAIGACVLGMAEPYLTSPPVEHVGRGAQIELLLDRSRSMDEPFAGNLPTAAVLSGRAFGHESKGAAACRLLADFVRHREHDLIGMLAFTTIPIPIIDFTPRSTVVEAAIRAAAQGRGLAETDMGQGLKAALAQFAHGPYNGSRVIVLVSDGGARLEADEGLRISAAMKQQRVALYWLYLRTNRSAGLRAEGSPERALDDFFAAMGTPYHAYEAEDPEALRRAMADVDALEHLPIRYTRAPERTQLAEAAHLTAWVCVLLLCLADAVELQRWT